jgi:hypothetical protein
LNIFEIYLDGRAPTFVKKVADASAPVNGEAIFTVEYDGNPAPEVKWFRNGLELSSAGRYRISTKPDESKSTLTFTEAWESDNNAKISCEIINPLGKDACEAVFHVKSKIYIYLKDKLILIIILAPPKIQREPEEQRVQLGDTLKVKIPITGKGPFTFKVKKDDQPLADNDRVRIQEYDDFIVVTIPGSYFFLSNQFLFYIFLFLQMLNVRMQVNMQSMLRMNQVHAMYH